MAVMRKELLQHLEQRLAVATFEDYCPNGLQVEGRRNISHIVTGVTASQALLDAAVAAKADAVLVHHGYFWKGESPVVVGMKRRRLQTLLRHDINLMAYHLPLDAHPELGNNVQLATRLSLEKVKPLGDKGDERFIFQGFLPKAMTVPQLSEQLQTVLQRQPLAIVASDKPIQQLVWCTGAAQGAITKAAAIGADAYISGEISESTVHIAREMNIHYFAAGHHATERYGIQALGEYLAHRFQLTHQFIDIDNPV